MLKYLLPACLIVTVARSDDVYHTPISFFYLRGSGYCALLDGLAHHVNILEINGESYRLNQSRSRTKSSKQ